jgi:hypothetical protein
MYATASEAIEGLRHKRTGEILPTKVIARNTKLIYLDDDLVGLRFHDTIIARYERNGVRIDTRDRHNPTGWFTKTTWERIDEFTPARTFQHKGLRHIYVDPFVGNMPYRGRSLLYAHGAYISPDGSCELSDLVPEQSDAILHLQDKMPRRVKRYCEKVVKAWRAWEETLPCCQEAASEAEWLTSNPNYLRHCFSHFNADQPVVPWRAMPNEQELRDRMLEPDRLADELVRTLTATLRPRFLSLAIAQIAPNFPYPQTPPFNLSNFRITEHV